MADKTFKIQFDVDANLGPIKTKVADLKNAFNNVKLPDNIRKSLETTFQNLNKEITNFETLANKGFSNMADVNKANKSFDKIITHFSKLQTQMKNLKGVDANKLLPVETLKRVQNLQKEWEKLRAETGKGLDTSNIIADLDKISNKLKDIKAERTKLIKANESMGSKKGGYTAQLTKLEADRTAKLARATELEGTKGGVKTQEYTTLKSDLRALNKQINEINEQYSKFTLTIDKNKTKIAEYDVQIKKLEKQEKELNDQLKELENTAKSSPEGIKNFINELKQLEGIDQYLDEIEEAGEDLEKLQQILANYKAGKIKEATDNLNGFSAAIEQTEAPIENAKQELDSYSDSVQEASERSKELEHVANQVKQFFSVGNTVQLFKRAIRSAFDTIKELDAVMTQTAVVTDFTVGDMWAQLPEYTKRANELGVSVKGAYEAATLYYQQGLETNEVIGVSNETLKMAKIAAIDYATATDYMTSALRGFNMEVNEDSARRINDIYSELAARTAADTEEISIAMSKTAPLAHNAGMEIETTAALLSQMIETTREAPETLGTAMKTVIARFQELKKDPSLIEPVEGEIVDANKIETALRTIGVALRDTNGQFRDLDDVFLEISKKWNSLDTNTQRYIATIAAGSRQQSRFIAMMANYERTAELVAMANNSAGASQEQFEKTLESMQSKLDRLKNAWNEYTMGLANNAIIKGAIDLLTKFLNMINKLSSAASGKKGIFKSLIDIGLLIGGLKLAKAAFNGFFGWLTKGTALAGKAAGNSFGKGFFGSLDKNIAKVKNFFSKTTWITPKDFKNSLKILDETKQKYQSLAKTLNESNFAEVARSQQAYQASLSNLGKSLRLTNSEMEVSNLLQSAGAEAGLANAAAAGGLSKEKAKEAIANAKAAASTEADVAAKLNDVIATDTLNASEKLENATKRTGILTQAKAIAQMLFSTGKKQAEAFATFELAHANIAASASYQALKAAMMSLPFGWILAGIAAVVAALIIIPKIIHAISIEGRMEKAAEATERAKESANEAKEAYNDLLSGRSEYNDLQNTLDELIYGTLEWKQALIEANQEVLELLQTFPELAQYLEKNNQGRLSISDEGWDKVIEDQLRQVNLTTGAVTLSQLRESSLNSIKLEKEFNKELYSIFGGKGYSKELTTLLNQGISSNFKEELEKNFNIPIYATEEDLEKAAQAILKYDTAVQSNQLQMENSAQAFLSTALDQDIYDKLGDAADGVINTFAQQMIESSDDVKKESNKLYALNLISGGVSKSQLEKQYAELIGSTLEDVKNRELTEKELIEEITKARKSDELLTSFEEYAEWVVNSTEEGVKTVTEILGDNFENFDSNELEKIAKGSSSLESLADSLKLDSKTLEKTIIGLGYVMDDGTADFKAFAEDFGDSIQLMIDQIHQSRVDLISSMMDSGVFGTQGTFKNSNELQAYLNSLTDQQVVGLSQMMDNISSLSAETQRNIFKNTVTSPAGLDAALEFVDSIDFSDPINALLTLQEEANNTKSAFSLMSQEIIELEPELFSTSNLFRSFVQSTDFEDLNDELKEFVDNEGKISPANIKELAKSSDRLNDLLKTGKISAGALAKAFTAFETAGIPVDHFTDRVLEALSVTEDFEDTLYELQDIYSNFDPGLDENFGVNFLSDALEKMQEYAANGQYNNSAFKEYFKEVFGEDALNQALNDVLEGGNPQAIFGRYLNQLSGDLSNEGWGFWDRLVGQSSNGVQVLADAAGNIILDTGHKTSEQVEEELANMAGVSLDTAKAMLAMYREYSFDIDAQLNQNDYLARLEKLKESGGGVITEQEVQAYAVSIDSTPEQVKADLDGSIKVVDWFDTSGLPKFGADLERQIGQVIKDVDFGGKGEGFQGMYDYLKSIGAIDFRETEEGIEQLTVDYDKLTESASTYLGISQEQASQESQWLSEQLLSAAQNVEQGHVIEDVTLKADLEIVQPDETGAYTVDVQPVYADDANTLQAGIDEELKKVDYGIIATEIAGLDLSGMTTEVQNSIATGANNGINAANSKIRAWQIPSKTLNLKVNVNKSGIPAWLRPLLDSGVAQVTGTDNGRTTPRGTVLASGTGPSGLSRKETALTGEEGYELAYDSHGAFILGANGPEIADLEKGTVVFPHDESKKILKGNKKKRFQNYAGGNDGGLKDLADGLAHSTRPDKTKNANLTAGTVNVDTSQTDVTSKKTTTTTDQTDKDTPDPWENPYDKLYNLTKKINAELRYREKLERSYQKLLNSTLASGEEIDDNLQKQLASLKQRGAYEQEKINARRKQISDYFEANPDMSNYFSYDPILEEVQIKWDEIEKLNGKTDSASVALGEKIEKDLSKIEEWSDDIQEGEKNLEEIEDTTQEIYDRSKEQYIDFEQRVLDALITLEERRIEEMEKINEAIDEANSDLIDAMRNSIDKMRQDRENEEKETSLEEKQRRLAYLRQDTTGSNALEIKKLEEELKKDRQDYTDSLVDQGLNALQRQNEVAKKQRDEQIKILNEDLNWKKEHGYFNEEAKEKAIEAEKLGVKASGVWDLLVDAENIKSKSYAQQEQAFEDTQKQVKESRYYVQTSGIQSNNYMDEMQRQRREGNIQGFKNTEEARNKFLATEYQENKENEAQEAYQKGKNSDIDMSFDYQAAIDKAIKNEDFATAFEMAGARDRKFELDPNNKWKEDTYAKVWSQYTETFYPQTNMMEDYERGLKAPAADREDYARKYQQAIIKGKWHDAFYYAGVADIVEKKTNSEYFWTIFDIWMRETGTKKYKTGGIVDYTGPAWLDGSKSKPEAVLNAKDTENFIQLKNILSDLRNTTSNNNTLGDWYFDIDINVDEISNDYDVDNMVKKVKQSIYEESVYRNVNAINFLK